MAADLGAVADCVAAGLAINDGAGRVGGTAAAGPAGAGGIGCVAGVGVLSWVERVLRCSGELGVVGEEGCFGEGCEEGEGCYSWDGDRDIVGHRWDTDPASRPRHGGNLQGHWGVFAWQLTMYLQIGCHDLMRA